MHNDDHYYVALMLVVIFMGICGYFISSTQVERARREEREICAKKVACAAEGKVLVTIDGRARCVKGETGQ